MDLARPLLPTDALTPPPGALPLAGGPLWFDRAELTVPGAAPRVVAAADLPAPLRQALAAPRAPLCGLTLDRPRIMGILNVTPDSFSDGGRFLDPAAAVAQARAMAAAGADILDIGGESTRPGAAEVGTQQEIDRTAPVIEALRAAGLTLPISIDTRKAAVARAALAAGADMVNDVSGLTHDPDLAGVVARAGVPVVVMHMRGTPATMTAQTDYADVLAEVAQALADRVAAARAAGIAADRIVIDPGIGFAKTGAQNLALIRGLALFHSLGLPLLLGASRKRFIGTYGGAPDPAGRMPGSVAVAVLGAQQGAQILRVHDVEETRQAIALWRALALGDGEE
ncbi:MAG: dihydropteroate synthase [Rhodobacterales bacterium]|nr:dihydropteroate synthase [Rhodobacterales bacterium]